MAALIYVAIFEPVTQDSQYNFKRYKNLFLVLNFAISSYKDWQRFTSEVL